MSNHRRRPAGSMGLPVGAVALDTKKARAGLSYRIGPRRVCQGLHNLTPNKIGHYHRSHELCRQRPYNPFRWWGGASPLSAGNSEPKVE